MKIVIDACVLYPTVMRQVVLGTAETIGFTPLWSARLLDEWQGAAAKHGAETTAHALAEIAQVKARFPKAEICPPPELAKRLWLPDPADIHVLATAVHGGAEAIMTLNAKDFPRHLLAEHGITRLDPDAYLLGVWKANPDKIAPVVHAVLATARQLSGQDWTLRALLKKARLPRLGKALG